MQPHSLYEISKDEISQLAVLAIEAKEKAYCPYSKFRVGASVLLSQPVNSSLYHTGANVEIASTPVGICAERCALAPIVASIKRPELPTIRAIAVSTDIWPPSSPCGMCRQFLREFCEQEMKVFMFGKRPNKDHRSIEEEANEEIHVMTMAELLPNSFGPNDLDKRKDTVVGNMG